MMVAHWSGGTSQVPNVAMELDKGQQPKGLA